MESKFSIETFRHKGIIKKKFLLLSQGAHSYAVLIKSMLQINFRAQSARIN